MLPDLTCADDQEPLVISDEDLDESLQNFDIIGYPEPEEFIEGSVMSKAPIVQMSC